MAAFIARRSFRFAAGVLGLAILSAAAPAVASPAGGPIAPPNGPKLQGQLKNGYNQLCMADGDTTSTGTTIAFEKCKTVNGGYTAPGQYFYLLSTGRGVEIKTHHGLCVGERLNGNPTSGDILVTKKCDASDTNVLFVQAGGANGVPYYWTAESTAYKATSLAIGYRTKSVGSAVALNPNTRDSSQAWHGTLARV